MAFDAAKVVVTALLLAACQGGGRVDVSGKPDDIGFTFTDTSEGKPLCADSLSVTPVAPDGAEPVWRVIAVDPARCAERMRFGRATRDFAEEVKAAPLRPDVLYRVRASGAGFSVVRDFRITRDGVTQDEP